MRQRVDIAVITGVEDVPLEISGISLRDVDASERAGDIGHFTGLVEVTLVSGTLTFAPNAPISMFISGDGMMTVQCHSVHPP